MANPNGNDVPTTMRAAAIERFGGPEVLELKEVPVPDMGRGDVLMRVAAAGVGVWDPFEREGDMAGALPTEPEFPYVMGTDGAGVIVRVGDDVERFSVGDRVYGFGYLDPKATFYAEYAVVDAEDNLSHIPEGMPFEQAGTMPADAMTALRGLDEVLGIGDGDRVMIFGASGGVGHMAVQLAKRMGAAVLAVASGDDGVDLVRRLGADAVVEGRHGDVAGAVRDFAPDGLDAVLATAGGDALHETLDMVRPGGRVAYPNGVRPEPQAPAGKAVEIHAYDGMPTRSWLDRLDELIANGAFEVHVAEVYPLEQAAQAHRRLDEHFLGKLALRP